MDIHVIRLLVDFGLVVLIWLVQLVIYPGFAYYLKADLRRWHDTYTSRVSYVVFPLMTSQLGLASWLVYHEQNWYSISSIIIVGLLWLITFVFFVPLHNRISEKKSSEGLIADMVLMNWSRTFLWSLLFGLGILFRINA